MSFGPQSEQIEYGSHSLVIDTEDRKVRVFSSMDTPEAESTRDWEGVSGKLQELGVKALSEVPGVLWPRRWPRSARGNPSNGIRTVAQSSSQPERNSASRTRKNGSFSVTCTVRYTVCARQASIRQRGSR